MAQFQTYKPSPNSGGGIFLSNGQQIGSSVQQRVYGPPAPSGQTLGAYTGPSAPAPVSGQGAPVGGQSFGPVGAPDMSAVNAQVDQASNMLGQAIPGAQQSEADQEASINASKASQLAQAQQGFGVQTQTLNNASDQARQQTSQLLQGIQSRYGGTTGEGSFASTQLGQQAVQTQAQIQQKIAQVQDVSRLAQQDIEQKAGAQITAAKQWLNDTLNSIRSNQATLQSHKADLSYAAMQQYQGYLEQLNASKQNLLSSLAQQEQAAKLGLYGALQNGSNLAGAGQGFLSQLGLQGMGGTQAATNYSQPASSPGTVPGQQKQQGVDAYGNPIPQY